MKYEFTGETKVQFGVTFKRIRALVNITAWGVVKGDLGGWIEKEENLSQVSGNAWVYGDARVYGNAWVYGDAKAKKTPIQIGGLGYLVTITDNHMQIGCEVHLLTQWQDLTNEEIAKMDGCNARRFWDKHKEILLGIAKANGRL